MVDVMGRREKFEQMLKDQIAAMRRRRIRSRRLVERLTSARVLAWTATRMSRSRSTPDGRMTRSPSVMTTACAARARELEQAIMEAYADAGCLGDFVREHVAGTSRTRVARLRAYAATAEPVLNSLSADTNVELRSRNQPGWAGEPRGRGGQLRQHHSMRL